MKALAGLIGLLLITVAVPKTMSAQLGSGPESVIGLGTSEISEFSLLSDESQVAIKRSESPFALINGEYDTSNPTTYFDYTGTGSNSFYHLSLINRDNDFHGVAGFSLDKFKLSTNYGNSDGILSSRPGVVGVAPNFFHGAVAYDYEYGGSTFGLSLSDNFMMHGGATFISAEGLENRSVYYSGFSYKNFYSTLNRIKRSDQAVGYSLVTGLKFDAVDLLYQELSSNYGATWREITIGLSANENLSKLRFSMGIGDNRLHEAGEERRFVMMYSIPIGGVKKSGRYGKNDYSSNLNSQLTASANSFRRLRDAGVIALSSGVALSSGNARLDGTPRFKSQHGAAYYALHNFNPISVRQNREYASSIYINRDRTYSPNKYVSVGTHDSVVIYPYYQIPYGTRPTAVWHTHGAYMPQYISEQFSPMDIQSHMNMRLDGYLGTPFGRMRYFNVESGHIYTFHDKGRDIVLPH